VGQFSSSGGRWQPRAANVRAVEPAPDHPRAERGSLYLLIEVTGTGGGHAALYRQLLNAAQTAYYEVGEAVEVALRQSVREVQSILRRANEALPEAQWRAGMTMVVRYGRHLVIGQAGPSLLLVSHPKTVNVFPEKQGESGPALGGPERPEVFIYDATLEPGSVVLLAQSAWTQQVRLEALAVAAAATSVSAATQYLGQLAGKADLSALLVGFDYDIPSVKDEAGGIKPLASGGATGVATAPDVEAEPPKPQGKGLFGGLFGKGREAERVEPDEDEAAVDEAEVVEPEAVLPPVIPVAPPVMTPPQATPSVVPPATTPPARTPAAPRPAEPAPSAEEWHAANAWEQRLAAGQPAAAAPAPVAPPLPAERELAPEPAPFVPVPPPRKGRSAWALVLAVVLIPLLIVGVVVAMLYVRTQAADKQFAEVVAGAKNVIAQAETAPDDAAAAQRLSGAKAFLDQAKALRPDDAALKDLEKRYDDLVMRVEKVTPLYGSVPLWPFSPETGHQLSRVVVSGESLFVLDKGPNAVYRFTFTSSLGDNVKPAGDKPVVRKGDPAGDKTVGDLIDMTWIEAATANQRSKLYVLDATGELIGYDEVYAQQRLQINRTNWVTAQLIAGYNGNLYVADSGADQVWKYAPTANGYEGDPAAWFQAGKQPDMANLVAMDIDGFIWLLYSDGRLLKFRNGDQQAFAWSDLPNPLNGPTALAVSQEGDRLYVADPGNARIVEATKDGKFLRQFKAKEGDMLRNVRHLYLDEAKAFFYILTGDQLYKASVPQVAATQ
jgi:sugar lactone lactonase YvrE